MQKGIQIFSISGKSALITGATGYLGSAMANALAEAGAHVFVNARSRRACNNLVSQIQDAGYSAEALPFDVTDESQMQKSCNRLEKQPLHILVNNASASTLGNMREAKPQSYRECYEVILVAAHNLFKCTLPNLRKAARETGDASVINIASIYGMVSPDQKLYSSDKQVNPPFYGAAKAALIQWTRYAACEFGKQGVRVNAISPGPFPSKSTQKEKKFVRNLSTKNALGRIGQAAEIRGPLLFLASPASSYVTGSNVVVDGGWTAL